MKPRQIDPLPPSELFRQYADTGSFASLATVVGREDFAAFYLPLAERAATRLQELPLSQTAFPDRGGALQCAFRSGLLAVRMCDKTIFSPTASAAERMVGDRNYRWLSYCAVLATVYLQAIANCETILESGEVYSHADDESLFELKQKYELRWRSKGSLTLSRLHILLSEFWFPGQFAHLSFAVLNDLGQAINPAMASSASEPPLARLVRQSIERTLSDDIAERACAVGEGKAMPGVASMPEEAQPATSAQAPQAAEKQAPRTAPTAPPESPTSRPAPGPAAEPQNPAAQKAIEWIRAIAMDATFDGEIHQLSDGSIDFSRKAFSFGAAPKDTYTLLHTAGFIERKAEKSASIKAMYAHIYLDARRKREGGV